jgi:hypothetical protein
MPARRSPKRTLFRIGVIIAAPILLLGGCLLLDQIPMSAARPPADLKTIEDFRTWKHGAIMGSGTFEDSGVIYTVMLAPAGRYLASGPSAYLFDEQGQFVDWTADMGDFYTVKNRFDLTSGHVKNINREKR